MEFGRTDAIYNPIVGSTSQTVQYKGREESSPRQKGKRQHPPLADPTTAPDEEMEGEPHHKIDIRI
jgi:hypothetical protein